MSVVRFLAVCPLDWDNSCLSSKNSVREERSQALEEDQDSSVGGPWISTTSVITIWQVVVEPSCFSKVWSGRDRWTWLTLLFFCCLQSKTCGASISCQTRTCEVLRGWCKQLLHLYGSLGKLWKLKDNERNVAKDISLNQRRDILKLQFIFFPSQLSLD